MESPFTTNDVDEMENVSSSSSVSSSGPYCVSPLSFPILYPPSPTASNVSEQSQPYMVAFHCSRCRKPYYSIMHENPWYTVYKHTCPHCHQLQVPTFDINLPINARELDPNVEYFYNQVKDDEFLDLNDVDESPDFSLEMTEPVFRLVFADQIKDDNDQVSSSWKYWQENVNLRLLALVSHAVCCNTFQHSSAKHTNLCRNTKILLLHIAGCQKIDCLFPLCSQCRPVLSYLSCFPAEATLKKKMVRRSPVLRKDANKTLA